MSWETMGGEVDHKYDVIYFALLKTKIREECIKRWQEGSKSKDRLDLGPDETQYLQRLFLSHGKVNFRYRFRCIAMGTINLKEEKAL